MFHPCRTERRNSFYAPCRTYDRPRPLFHSLAQRRHGGERSQRQGGEQKAAQDQQMPVDRQSLGRRVDRADREDQHRHVKRQDQQRQQHPAAPRPQHQSRAHGADQAEGRSTQQKRQHQGEEGILVQMQQQRQHRRRQQHRQGRGQPMGGDLADHQYFQRRRRQGQQFQRTILVIALEQPVERQHRGQQRG